MTIQAITRKSRIADKPNEDAFSASPTRAAACIADGVTRFRNPDGSYPRPSPARLAAMGLAEAVERLPSPSAPHECEPMLRACFAAANENIARIECASAERPGTVGSAVLLTGDLLAWAHLGDGAILLMGPNLKPLLLTRDQMTLARAKVRKSCPDLDPDARKRFMQQTVLNRRDIPDGYGVLTGDPAALDFVETGTVRLEDGQRIVLATDGLGGIWKALSARGGQALAYALGLLYEGELEQIVSIAESIESTEGAASDDKTIVHIKP
jgi:serine/threonine protein phosphatase PrpC